LKVQSSSSSEISINYQGIIDQIDFAEIKMNIRKLVEFKSRVTGYNGYEEAANFIYQSFIEYGLANVSFEYYNLTVPIEYYANITILPKGKSIKAYTLWPNLVETCALPPEGIEGKLVYVGKGELRNYSERINGNIVLMDFDSRDNWLYAAQLGAKAVIFIEKKITRWESELKVLDIPLDFPRLYVKKEEGNFLLNLLKKGDVYVNVKSLMVYKACKVKNVIGYVPGSDPQLKNEVIVISAYYDSYSVVPSLAPGAEEACGIATLLEYAKFLGKPENRPKRTIMFVALSGHNFALAGAREFVYDHLNDVGSKLKLWINLDLSTTSKKMGVFCWGRFYGYSSVIGRYGVVRQKIFDEYKPMIEEELGRQYEVEDFMLNFFEAMLVRGLNDAEPLYLDSEPFSLAGGLGVSFYSFGGLRIYRGTPFDTYEKLRFENLKPQVEFIFCVLTTLLNDGQIEWPNLKPNIASPSEGGFASLVGRVVEYNRSVGWYTAVPNALVVLTTPSIGDLGLLSQKIIVQANDEGYYVIHGVEHLNSYPPGSRLSAFNDLEAYLDDPTYGPVEYAPDHGKYAVYQSRHIPIDLPEKFVNIVVFRCGTISILGVPNPRGVPLTILNLDIRIFGTDQVPDFYGYISDAAYENVMVFGEPKKRFEIILRSNEVEPFGVLTNATEEVPEGTGFELNEGHSIIVNAFQIAWDTFHLDEFRIRKIQKWKIPSVSAASLHNKTRELLQSAINALLSHPPDYETFMSNSIQALSGESSAYVEIKNIIKDTIDTTVFFYVLLLPFALVAERLIVSARKPLKRIVWIVAIFSLLSFLFYFLHPGFHIAFNTYMTLNGFILIVFISPVVILLFTKLITIFKEIRKEALGFHFAEISRGSAFLIAASLGIENMRRRKLRTILTLASTILIVFSIIALSALSSIKVEKPIVTSGRTLYQGIFIRETLPILPPIPRYVIDVIYASVKDGLIARRIDIVPARPIIFTSQSGETFLARALIGLERTEAEVTGVNNSLIEGIWFPSDLATNVCIIPEEAAKQLNIDVGENITFYGINLKVIGIFDSKAYSSIVDLDQGILTPTLAAALGGRMHSSPAETVIIPYCLAHSLSKREAHSIVIRLSEPDKILKVANQLSATFPGILVYASINNGEVVSYSRDEQISVSGLQMMIVPIVISALTTFNMLLGSVYERIPEIRILSLVGLSPKHVLGLFLVECTIYVVISAVVGYVLGLTANVFLISLNLLPPEFTLNTASSWVIIAVSSSLAPILLPGLYAARCSANLVTPSLERAWKIPTKPEGDEWSIPLPFKVEVDELNGVLAYMMEYFKIHSTERAGVFWIRDLQYSEKETPSALIKSLKMIVRLAPYEAGLEQESELLFIIEKEHWQINVNIHLKRISGIFHVWKAANRMYIDSIRKQLLLWRSLREPEKRKYLSSSIKG